MIAIAVLFLLAVYALFRVGFAVLRLLLGMAGLVARGLLALSRRRMVR